MKMKFNPELTQQEIYAIGSELASLMGHDVDEKGNRVYEYPNSKAELVATLHNPILVTDNHKIFQIKDYTTRETVQLLLTKPLRVIEYDGVSLDFEQGKYPSVRSPSIDTLLFCKALKKIDLSKVETAAEIGSGPGFIAKYIRTKVPNIKKVVMNDINPYAQKYFDDHYDDKRMQFNLGSGIDYLKGKKFDLIVCNPPYIPRPQSIDDNPYEGLQLLSYLISHASEHLNQGGSFITNISSLADDVIDKVIAESGVKIEILDEMEVPLKVGNVLNNKQRMTYLINEKGLKENYHDGHKYRQKLKIVKITP